MTMDFDARSRRFCIVFMLVLVLFLSGCLGDQSKYHEITGDSLDEYCEGEGDRRYTSNDTIFIANQGMNSVEYRLVIDFNFTKPENRTITDPASLRFHREINGTVPSGEYHAIKVLDSKRIESRERGLNEGKSAVPGLIEILLVNRKTNVASHTTYDIRRFEGFIFDFNGTEAGGQTISC